MLMLGSTPNITYTKHSMSEQREPAFKPSPATYSQVEGLLRAGTDNPEGYFFDHYRIDSIGMEVDRLRYSPYGAVVVELRQAVNQPEGLEDPRPFESRNTGPKPFDTSIIMDLTTPHPAMRIAMEFDDGFRQPTRKASWRFYPSGEMKYNMAYFPHEHGHPNIATKLEHLDLILSKTAIASTLPEFFYIRDEEKVRIPSAD